MSVVIIGGHERMSGQYEKICRAYGCKVKILVKEQGSCRKKIGVPDLIILFTATVSHKMVHHAVMEAKRSHIQIARIPVSSAAALHSILEQYCTS